MDSLLPFGTGSVTAPAGCGKTYLIAKSVSEHKAKKPILVLTHTNAGVAALRNRFKEMNVPTPHYRIMTIDGWTMNLVSHFPARSGVSAQTLEVRNPGNDYSAIRQGSLRILTQNHVSDVIRATYDRVIIDEYQDCTMEQHSVAVSLSQLLTTTVLGDEMQAIFGWAGTPVDWTSHVQASFPALGELKIPYRWNNVGAHGLGSWLLYVRKCLVEKKPINLEKAPAAVSFIQLTGDKSEDFERVLKASKTPDTDGGGVIIICNSRKKQRHRDIASRIYGGSVVENADLTDLVNFARSYDFTSEHAANNMIDFAGSTMSGIGASKLKTRLNSLLNGTAQTKANTLEAAAVKYSKSPTPREATNFLSNVSRQPGVTTYRPDILRNCIKALGKMNSGDNFYDVVVSQREQARVFGRSLRSRSIGSTLLVKGLEADIAVLADTDDFDAKDLYVAMTRGAKQLIICSRSSLLHRP